MKIFANYMPYISISYVVRVSLNVFPCINPQRCCCGWSGEKRVDNFRVRSSVYNWIFDINRNFFEKSSEKV